MKKNINTAFTLVELIVVITILAVLATVAFISFQGYTSSSRDWVRLADLKNISKSFEINRTKDIDFPLPDKKVDISASGTIFQYQWELSQNILESDLNIFDGGLDPVTKQPYGYAVNLARNKFQIIWFLENQESVANISTTTTFADNSDKYIKSSGDSLGILLNETTNEIITASGSFDEIDIEAIVDNYSIIIWNKITKWNSDYIKDNLSFRINAIESCKSILYNWNSKWDGMYTINPTGLAWDDFEVYCDMSTDWWGWTLLANAIGEDTSVYDYDDIVNWNPSNSINCNVDNECLSESWVSLKQWWELMIYTRWYKVKWTQCNDKNLSIKWYTHLDRLLFTEHMDNWTKDEYWAQWTCDDIIELGSWKKIEWIYHLAWYDWQIWMWIWSVWNSNWDQEYSVLQYGRIFMPQWLWTARWEFKGKINNFYDSDTQHQLNLWEWASTEQQTWFVR